MRGERENTRYAVSTPLIQSVSCFFCTRAPTRSSATLPSLKTMRVGMARMRYFSVVCGFWSTFDLDHLHLALELGGHCLQRRRHGLAGAAPLGEEIDDHRLGRSQHLVLEVRIRDERRGAAHVPGLLHATGPAPSHVPIVLLCDVERARSDPVSKGQPHIGGVPPGVKEGRGRITGPPARAGARRRRACPAAAACSAARPSTGSPPPPSCRGKSER